MNTSEPERGMKRRLNILRYTMTMIVQILNVIPIQKQIRDPIRDTERYKCRYVKRVYETQNIIKKF